MYALRIHNNMASDTTSALAGYRVGEISQALLTNKRPRKKENNENDKLNALFSSARVFQPEFVPVAPKVRGDVSTICLALIISAVSSLL